MTGLMLALALATGVSRTAAAANLSATTFTPTWTSTITAVSEPYKLWARVIRVSPGVYRPDTAIAYTSAVLVNNPCLSWSIENGTDRPMGMWIVVGTAFPRCLAFIGDRTPDGMRPDLQAAVKSFEAAPR